MKEDFNQKTEDYPFILLFFVAITDEDGLKIKITWLQSYYIFDGLLY